MNVKKPYCRSQSLRDPWCAQTWTTQKLGLPVRNEGAQRTVLIHIYKTCTIQDAEVRHALGNHEKDEKERKKEEAFIYKLH